MAVMVKLEGLERVQAEMRDIAENQIPFATAKMLTKTAQAGQRVVQTTVLPKKFTLRSPAWMKQGIRITPATKKSLQSAVEDIHAFMDLQETGGTKIPYGNAIAIPITGGARPSARALIPAGNMPSKVMANGGFILQLANGMGLMCARFLKAGRRKRDKFTGQLASAKWSRPITPMYLLVPRATVKARYGFVESVVETVESSWKGNFNEAFLQAVRTATK